MIIDSCHCTWAKNQTTAKISDLTVFLLKLGKMSYVFSTLNLHYDLNNFLLPSNYLLIIIGKMFESASNIMVCLLERWKFKTGKNTTIKLIKYIFGNGKLEAFT